MLITAPYMGFSISTVVLAALIALVAVGYLLWWLALPRPYTGIPYNRVSAKRILGDLPDLLDWQKADPERKFEIWKWISEQNAKLNSPIIQLFVRPLGKPFIIVADYREAADVLVKRSHDFDRSDFFRDLFGLIIPRTMAHFKTGELYWTHRKMMANTMSSSFLNTVAAPQIYAKALDTISLWKEKSRLARGCAYSVKDDIYRTAFDIIWAATFSSDIGTVQNQVEGKFHRAAQRFAANADHYCALTWLLSCYAEVELPENKDKAIHFPVAEDPAAFRSVTSLAASIETVAQVPIFPVFAHWLQLKTSSHLRWAMKYKDQILSELVDRAAQKFETHSWSNGQVASALESMVQREVMAAHRDNRNARFDGPEIKDELLSLLIGGWGTTSTTLCWGLKLLARHQDVQAKLRFELKSALERNEHARGSPSLDEILKTELPYLDAVIEEVHRCGGTVPAISRSAVRDTQILGHAIPKGAEVFFLIDGPGYTAAPVHVDESQRSESSRDDKRKSVAWTVSSIDKFMPDRWLLHTEDGHIEINPNAGPIHAFGAGPRGCFGKKFAIIELRVLITLIIWNFELQPVLDPLASFAGHDKILREPEMCYLRTASIS